MPKATDQEDKSNVSDEQRVQSVVETALAEDEKDTGADDDQELDENSEDQDGDEAGDDANKSEDTDSDEDEEDENSDDKTKEVERKFKNLASDDDKTYITNLEKAYENSSSEAVRLNQELAIAKRRNEAMLQAVASDPELAKKLAGAADGVKDPTTDLRDAGNPAGESKESPTDNPFLTHAETEWREKSAKEVQEIIDANPELVSDPVINEKVKYWMRVFSKQEFELNKRVMTGGEAMTAAMRHLNIEDKREKSSVASGMKDLAAPTRRRQASKPAQKSKQVSDQAYKFGELMGVSKEQIEKYAD